MKRLIWMVPLALCVSLPAGAAGVDGILAGYQAAGAGPFDAARGKELWNRSFGKNPDGHEQACVTCHTADPRKGGKHVKTGKEIEPMSPAVNKERLTDPEKVEKWFKRNCDWTLDRECTPQEKGDVLMYLKQS